MIAVPIPGAPDATVTVTVFVFDAKDTPETPVMGLGPLKTKGRLLVNVRFSHLVGCVPYSKSVSISACGCDTLDLFTGSA